MLAPEQYKDRKRARVDRLRARAERVQVEADRRGHKALAMSRVMQGEPIKVGHHSEGRHRRDIDRMDRDMHAAATGTREAQALKNRANAAEDNRAISADDPDAVDKLRAKLDALELDHNTQKRINAVVRSNPKNEVNVAKLAKLSALGLSEGTARKLFEPDFCGRIGVPSYVGQNRSANMKRIRDRIAIIEQNAAKRAAPGGSTTTCTHSGSWWNIIEHPDDESGRIWWTFDRKPSRAICKAMRGGGWRWSPQRVAWIRHLHNGSRYAIDYPMRVVETCYCGDLGGSVCDFCSGTRPIPI
jgi:hypothetical protein